MKYKKQFYTLDEAIAVAKLENARDYQLDKLVAYKCGSCFMYHIGRNGKQIKPKEKEKLRREVALDKPKFVDTNAGRVKIVGYVDLSRYEKRK